MQKIPNPHLKKDLRKQNTESGYFFDDISIKSCMTILFVFIVLLLSIISVVTSPNPSVLFGV
ncbi:MAG: hypothetical protein FWH29_08235 [Methanobrevibacter sp.]|nr:hypothetical protein [Methanobrevibacter sp.]